MKEFLKNYCGQEKMLQNDYFADLYSPFCILYLTRKLTVKMFANFRSYVERMRFIHTENKFKLFQLHFQIQYYFINIYNFIIEIVLNWLGM